MREEIRRQVRAEIPHATDADIRRAIEVKIELMGLDLSDIRADQVALEKMVPLLQRVETLTGRANLNAEEALAACAKLYESGNAEARDLDDQIRKALVDPFFLPEEGE